VNNENKPSHSDPGAANSDTEHSVHEAEAQHEEDGRSCKTESTANNFCAA
jgi:hypothetical protein